jgi:hypothetical protein
VDCAIADPPGKLRTAIEMLMNHRDITYLGLPKTTVPVLMDTGELLAVRVPK